MSTVIGQAPQWASEAERSAALEVLNDHHPEHMRAAMMAARWRWEEDQPTFARRLGVSLSTLRRWESGHYTWRTFEVYSQHAGLDLIAMGQAASRGYMAGIGSPYYTIEDASIGHDDMAAASAALEERVA
jgi:hypothetical protein